MDTPSSGYVMLGSFTIPGDARYVSHVRGFIKRTLAGRPGIDTDGATLLSSELVTNAIVHTKSGTDGGSVTIVVAAIADGVLVEVIDDGAAQLPLVRSDLYAPQGHGLYLVQQLAAQWGYLRETTGTTVWFHLPAAPAARSSDGSPHGSQDTLADDGEVIGGGDVGRHRVHQIAERAQPHAGGDGGGGRDGQVHLVRELHYAYRSEHTDIGNSWDLTGGRQSVAQALLDPPDLRLPAAGVRIPAEQDVEGGDGDGTGERIAHERRPVCQHG